MKKLVFLSVLSLFLACSGSRGFYTYHVVALAGAEDGTIYIEATGLAGNELDADNDAAHNAFKAVLFTGLPNSVQKSPLIDNEAKAKSEHPDIIDCFHTFKCYNQFIVNLEKVGLPKKVSNGLAVDLKIKINLRDLRTYLEQNHVIRKFGF